MFLLHDCIETVAPVLSDEEDDRITKTLQHDFDWLEHMIGESYEQALSGSPVPSGTPLALYFYLCFLTII